GKLGGRCLHVGCIPAKSRIQQGNKAHIAKGSEDRGSYLENVKVVNAKVHEMKRGDVNCHTSGVESLLEGNKVDIVKGEVYFVDDSHVKVMDDKQSQTYTYKNCIIATGSAPIEIPSFPFSKRVIDSTGALDLEEIPGKLVVIGG